MPTLCYNEIAKAYEELLYTGCNTARMVLQSLYNIAVQQGDLQRAKFLVDKHTALIRVYDMGDYAEAAAVLDHAAQTQNAELAVDALKRVLDSVHMLDAFTKSPLYAHMQFNEMDTGVEEQLREKLKQTFREDARFAFIRERSEWAELMA